MPVSTTATPTPRPLTRHHALSARTVYCSGWRSSGSEASGLTSSVFGRSEVARVVVVCPTDHLRLQWADAADRMGIVLDPGLTNAAAQALKLGPVVGERTWGGVVGIDGRYALVDGTRITQPRFAFWLTGYGWGVENHGVDPDIEVVMSPGDWHRPGDPQLDRAITEALDRLAVTPAAAPPELPPARIRRG